jgi:hypothetical protein
MADEGWLTINGYRKDVTFVFPHYYHQLAKLGEGELSADEKIALFHAGIGKNLSKLFEDFYREYLQVTLSPSILTDISRTPKLQIDTLAESLTHDYLKANQLKVFQPQPADHYGFSNILHFLL